MNSFETAYDFKKVQPERTESFFLQPKLFPSGKLTINNDQYEKEADAVADKVVGMENPFIQAKPVTFKPIQRKCAHCEDEEKKLQRKEMNSTESSTGNEVGNYPGNLRDSGQPLSNELRNFYEPRFGYDFSDVKIHTDGVAAKSAESINTLTYTSGNNIVLQRAPDKDTKEKPPPAKTGDCPTIVSLEATVKASSAVSDTCKKKCRMELGCCPTERGECGSSTTSGAVIKATVDAPKECAGKLGFMQNVLTVDRKRTLNDKTEECITLGDAHVDGGVPYKGCEVEVTGPGHYTIETDDCPFILLEDNMTAASANDFFKTFLLWKKTGEKSWQPVANVTWAWKAATVRKKGKDCESNWSAPAGKSSGNKGAVSTDKPVSSPDIRDDRK